jgi:hypothetical protein
VHEIVKNKREKSKEELELDKMKDIHYNTNFNLDKFNKNKLNYKVLTEKEKEAK